MRRAWAALERLLPRALVAVTSVVVASVTNPTEVGVYAWAILALTLFQAVTDQSVRHVSIAAVETASGEVFLRRYVKWSSAAGVLVMVAVSMTVALSVAHSSSALEVFGELALLALVPVPMALAVRPLAILQRASQWRSASDARVYGSLVGAAIGVPTALLTHSIVGGAVTVLLSETFFTAVVCARARRIPSTPLDHLTSSAEISKAFRSMQVYSAVAWAQGQADRLLIGAWSGTAQLGSYSLATSVGRSAGDAVAASQAAVLRADLASAKPETQRGVRALFSRHLLSTLAVSVGAAAASIVLAASVIGPILGPDWANALAAVPVLALAGIPSAVSWSSAPIHNFSNRSRRAILAPFGGLIMAPLIAIAATHSLVTAAWLVIAREVVLAALQLALMGRSAPWGRASLVAAVLGASSLGVALWQSV